MPAASDNIFGRIITRRDVELAVTSFLASWVPTYIGQIEQQAQLVPGTIPMPPDPINSYRGGLDFEMWMPSWSPMYIAICQADGLPQRINGVGTYQQNFLIQIGVNYQFGVDPSTPSLGAVEEDSSRQYADMLGMAACTAILQHGGLGTWPDGTPVSTKTVLLQYPKTIFPYPADESARRVARSTFSLRALIADVATEVGGPTSPLYNPYAAPGDWPTVGGPPTVTIDAITLNQPVPTPSPVDN